MVYVFEQIEFSHCIYEFTFLILDKKNAVSTTSIFKKVGLETLSS